MVSFLSSMGLRDVNVHINQSRELSLGVIVLAIDKVSIYTDLAEQLDIRSSFVHCHRLAGEANQRQKERSCPLSLP